MKVLVQNGSVSFVISPSEVVYDKIYNANNVLVAYNDTDKKPGRYLLNTGVEATVSSGSYGTTDYEIVYGYTSFTYSGKVRNLSIAYGIVCFYDADKNFISAYTTQEVSGTIEAWDSVNGTKTGTVPEGAVYMRAMCECSSSTTPFKVTFTK